MEYGCKGVVGEVVSGTVPVYSRYKQVAFCSMKRKTVLLSGL